MFDPISAPLIEQRANNSKGEEVCSQLWATVSFLQFIFMSSQSWPWKLEPSAIL